MTSLSGSRRRSYWLKTLHQWHWMSAALSLVGLILFAATGLTLNNAAWIEAKPEIVSQTLDLPPELIALIAPDTHTQKKRPLPGPLQAWLDQQLNIHIDNRPAEFSSDEIYLSLPEPGADAWLSIDVANGAVEYERSSRGWIAYFNDLHKGRHAGVVWSWFIDILAIACLIFALTGLFLVKLHAANRPSSWPLVSLGLVLPIILMLLFVH
ncbi:MAG TPA: PepSY-associated TM helix domain-containing protein [Candidimonas sp.]|nr:PepSY-associated TM helix domain-containing protein [Candidimonas sp.]